MGTIQFPLHEQSAKVEQDRDCSTPVDCSALVKNKETTSTVKCRCVSTFNRKIRQFSPHYICYFSVKDAKSLKVKKTDRLASNLSREEV